jgi:hypothetical protein
MLFRCTAAMRTMLGLKDNDLAEESADASPTEWYCHQVTIDRRKCVLFTHAVTLYSFMAPGVRKDDLRNFTAFFQFNLLANLVLQGFSSAQIAAFPMTDPIAFAKTNNRSILGSMNDFINACRLFVELDGGVVNTDFGEVNRRLSTTLMSGIGMNHPVDLLKALLAEPGRA